MTTLIKFKLRHIIDVCKVFLLTGGLIFVMSSCEADYIPAGHDGGHPSVSGKEGNFNLMISFTGFGEGEIPLSKQSMEDETSRRSMEPETDVIRVSDDLFIYATLAVDPADRAPAVKTRKFQNDATIRVVGFKITASPGYTQAFDELYTVDINGTLKRVNGSTGYITLAAGDYRLVAYSYNDPYNPPPGYAPAITGIDPVNDLIWGQSDTVSVADGTVTPIPITMAHKLSQVSLAATAGAGNPQISAMSGVEMPGYTVDLTVFDGTVAKNTALSQPFSFSTLNVDTVRSNTRTVYTAGDLPTVINIGSITVGSKTVDNVKATFAKALQSGYSYTMTMKVGNPAELTDDLPPEGFTPYVGAFWKATQTGERLMRMPRAESGLADGVWTATVVAGIDWIVLDTLMTADPNVGWRSGASEPAVKNGNDANFDTNYSVGGSKTYVGGVLRPNTDPNYRPGDENIYFRIGLKTPYTPTANAPARYGVVLLTYASNSKRQRIWIRQGEGDDYLMRPEDAGTGPDFTSPDRPAARQFSPYNLTTSGNFNRAVSINGAAGQTDPPAKFTDYPSQAGAFFQWASDTYKRYAYSPYATGVTPWESLSSATGYWTDATYYLADIYESCPEGYRRPTDGVTDSPVGTGLSPANMKLSEMRQSLYANPVAADNSQTKFDNTVYGYYADGFFDRRAVVTSANGIASSTVSAGNNSIAYRGRLFFNPKPDSYASIFFPAAGNLSGNSGVGNLNYTGVIGYYWSSSSPSELTGGGGGKALKVSSGFLEQSDYDRPYGFSIRCVVDVPLPAGAITISPDNIFLPYLAQSPAMQVVTVTPLKANGQPYPNAPWTLTSNQTWLTLSLNADGSGAATTLNGTGTQTVYLVVAANTLTVTRSVQISVTGSTSTTAVTQLKSDGTVLIGTLPTGANTYVGAFWRANETGERIIRIAAGGNAANLGTWKAEVVWYDTKWNTAAGDGIILSTVESSDSGITWNAATENPGDAENYQVAGDALSVSGTIASGQDIFFRIGLKKPFTAYNAATNPARYASIMLTYNNNAKQQRLYLRQGEGADYVMSPADAINSGGYSNSTRPEARKFLPYNLTDTTGNAPTSVITVGNPNVGIDLRGGSFVKYPTQGGYFFRWNYNRQAFSPTTPQTAAIGGWLNSQNGDDPIWVAGNTETCPPGYRRPYDGAPNNTSGSVSGSEMRQSLWSNPTAGNGSNSNGNSVWGYYADGFFDRRKAVTGTGTTPRANATVNAASNDAAYIGRLYFNPTQTSAQYNASLFFPAAGHRKLEDGSRVEAGMYGYYWSGTNYNVNNAWYQYFNDGTNVFMFNTGRTPALSIRCVSE